MFYFTRHERIGIQIENAQAGAGAEIDPLFVIDRARIIGWVFERAATGSFEYWFRFVLSHGSIAFIFLFFEFIPQPEYTYSDYHARHSCKDNHAGSRAK